MYLTMFLSSVSFSICMSSLWPYLKILDGSANTDFLGWVVASYSVGQLIASPLFGAWATYRDRSREPLVVSMLINVLANVLYSYLESIPSHQAVYLILSRSLVGFGAGNVAVVRSYVAGATTLKERTSAMAIMSAFQAVGFIIGPVIQIAMVPIGYPGPVHLESVHLDLYTSPAILSSIVGVINIILLFAVFKEHRVDNDDDINFSVQDTQSIEKSVMPEYTPDYAAVVSSILLFFAILFIFAVFETIGTPLTMHMYAWTKENATLYNGIILGVGGLISIMVFILIRILSKRFNERYILLGGFIMCLLGFVVYLPWGDNYPSSQTATISPPRSLGPNITDFTTSMNTVELTTPSWIDPTTQQHSSIVTQSISTVEKASHLTVPVTSQSINVTSHSLDSMSTMPLTSDSQHTEVSTVSASTKNKIISVISDINRQKRNSVLYFEQENKMEDLVYLDFAFSNMTTEMPFNLTTTQSNHSDTGHESTGCPDTYKWCSYTPIVTFPQFIFGTLMIVIGYPTCNVMTYTLYSKILGPKPQGMMMGWLTASGSLARTVGPIFVSQVYNAYGPRVTFVSMIIIVFLAILMLLFVFKRLVPFTFTAEISKASKM
ncbi:major facilitator superfamily domain-containing protein 8-like [Mytilus californianus]|uniref:major facilitator superfamily domain-containing protein 8-like n=1 Tax=Mytilus californianus TaxID=6549 RepID=UPI00224567D8|nr:major facilitator superfamily domain-containing protein 8-like [Mytilus californianus]